MKDRKNLLDLLVNKGMAGLVPDAFANDSDKIMEIQGATLVKALIFNLQGAIEGQRASLHYWNGFLSRAGLYFLPHFFFTVFLNFLAWKLLFLFA